MRCALLILALVACGNRDRDNGATKRLPANPRPMSCEPAGGTVCVDDEVVECLANRTLGAAVQRCPGSCSGGKCVETCAVQDVELVYVVDTDHNLSSFDPRKLPNDPFHTIGRLACDDKSSPFSMAVDRKGIAWINYHNGLVYRASIIDAKCKAPLHTSGAPKEFGMGFVSDGPNSDTEKLFVTAYDDSRFAELDITKAKPAWRTVAQLDLMPNAELTGTGGGQLYGFFPQQGDGFVQEIDRATGKLVGERMLVGSPRGKVGGWAFAHWGGNFYVFVTIDDNSSVYEIDGKTHSSKRVLEHLPHRIVGAGVSTCAPLLESTQ